MASSANDTDHGSSAVSIPRSRSTMIPRPAQFPSSIKQLYEPGSSKYSLLQQMRVYSFVFDSFTNFVREAAKNHLDTYKRWVLQDERAQRSFNKVCMKYPLMQQYEGGWPIELYISMYLPQSKSSTNEKPWKVTKSLKYQKKTLPKTAERKQPVKAKPKRAIVIVEVPAPPQRKKSRSDNQDVVLQFLRSLEPPQKQLNLTLVAAGVTGQKDFQALVQNAGVRNAFLTKLERNGELTYFESALIEDGLARKCRESLEP